VKPIEEKPRLAASKILPLERAYELVDGLKQQGKCVVFTNGCFDLVHLGHARYLAAAKQMGDVLIVAINSDPSVQALKGPGRPIIPQDERAETLAALEAVDYVTIFDNPTVQPVVARMLPDVLVKGAGWAPDEIVGRDEVEAAGGRVVSVGAAADVSSTDIIHAALKVHG